MRSGPIVGFSKFTETGNKRLRRFIPSASSAATATATTTAASETDGWIFIRHGLLQLLGTTKLLFEQQPLQLLAEKQLCLHCLFTLSDEHRFGGRRKLGIS